VTGAVDLFGGDARNDERRDVIQGFGSELSGMAHAFKGIGSVNSNLPCFRVERRCLAISHIVLSVCLAGPGYTSIGNGRTMCIDSGETSHA